MILARSEAFCGGLSVDGALDIEQRVNAQHGFCGHRRHQRRFTLLQLRIGIGEREELAPCVRSTERAPYRRRRALWLEQRVVSSIGIGLQNTAVIRKMRLWMFLPPVARIIE